jgi:hypothetical protein
LLHEEEARQRIRAEDAQGLWAPLLPADETENDADE